MILSLQEVLDIFIMVAAVGYIFKDSFGIYRHDYDPLVHKLDLEGIKLAAIVVGPGIVLHEMGHKFVALSLGIPATFHASYFWLVIGVALKFVGFPFIFFVPGYVTNIGAYGWSSFFISFAGPFVNLLLWLGCAAVIKANPKVRHRHIFALTSHINMFLFIFNMLPIFGFDGFHVYSSLLQALGVKFI